jgi:predicted phage replisome organizer
MKLKGQLEKKSMIKWIKITTDIFDDEKIQLIEELPESDTIIVIWFKLLILAGKRNDSGLIYITRDIPYDAEKLARVMRRELSMVKFALKTFSEFGMIAIEDDIIMISNWEKHQNIEGMDKIKEQNRLRQQRHREKQRLIAVTESNVKSRDGNAIDKNRIDKNRKETDTTDSNCQEIFDYWNTKKIVVHAKITTKMKSRIKSVLKEHDIENIKFAFDNYEKVLHSNEYMWTYKWTIEEFLSRGLERFNFEGCVERMPKNQNATQPPIIKPKINLEEVRADLDDAIDCQNELRCLLEDEYGTRWEQCDIKPGWREQWEQLTTKIQILQSKLKGDKQ